MYVKVRSLDELCAELKKKPQVVRSMLADLGVTIIDGFYDHARYESALAEPSWLRNKRKEWTLSPTTGLGAIKHALDPLKMTIVSHDMRGPNQYITIRDDKHQRHLCKVLYRNNWMPLKTSRVASFYVRGFMHEHAPDTYLMVCIEQPCIWMFKRTFMQSQFAKLAKHPPKYVKGVQCSWSDRELLQGGLHFWLDEKSDYLLDSADDLRAT